MIAPNVQGWFGDAFIGGGMGLGVGLVCFDRCDLNAAKGLDLRAGYRVARVVTVSVEFEALGGLFSSDSLTMVSALVGVQSF